MLLFQHEASYENPDGFRLDCFGELLSNYCLFVCLLQYNLLQPQSDELLLYDSCLNFVVTLTLLICWYVLLINLIITVIITTPAIHALARTWSLIHTAGRMIMMIYICTKYWISFLQSR